MKLKNFIYTFALAATGMALTTSCDDMLDKGNDHLVYAKDFIPCTPADTVTSVMGILNKLQAISVRTNLLGEVRADLVEVNSNATTDLKNLANFQADVTGDDDANIYNVPRDYYAVINNCNYFLAYADSTAGNINRNEKYFEYEIAQVHSIRAWTYLQLVLAYGKVPLVTDPVLTKLDSDKQYPMADISAICDYFIADLQPYYGKRYPDYGTVGGNIDPKMCFFPTQVVMGDLYLWKAAAEQSKAAAKQAAKSYYDFIVWDLSGKKKLTTGNSRAYWSDSELYRGEYSSPRGNVSSFGVGAAWGKGTSESITAIPMDSAAADGYYNELRNLYNTTNHTELREASISPSSVLRELSEAQTYVDFDRDMNVVEVDATKFTPKQIEYGYKGDLRYQDAYTTMTGKYNSQEVDYQYIYKHSSQHVGIYRTQQLYLRLAEALNYAGYPMFARAFLTTGVDNNVIKYEVMPYYPSAADSTFLAYFDFNTQDFVTPCRNYVASVDKYGIVQGYDCSYITSSNTATTVTMMGIHSRGCGAAYLNNAFCAVQTPQMSTELLAAYEQMDATHKPTKEDYEYPTKPTAPKTVRVPSTWAQYGDQVVSKEVYEEINKDNFKTATLLANAYKKYVDNDSIGLYKQYLADMEAYDVEYADYLAKVEAADAVYQADMDVYNAKVQTLSDQYTNWFQTSWADASLCDANAKAIDQAILDEQALELAYEGNRYYDLMRRAMWYGDANILASAVSRRNPSVGALLLNKSNWYLHWKGQIGL